MEYHFIKQFNTLYPNGYNMLEGGDYGSTHKNTRNRLSDVMLNNTNGKKIYMVTTPNGGTIIVENLKDYCKHNMLNYNTMLGVANGRKNHNHHKGFVCNHIDDDMKSVIVKRNTSGYIITSPDGNDIKTYDLSNFCKSIQGINRYGFIRLLQGVTKKGHYKGWKIRRINETN